MGNNIEDMILVGFYHFSSKDKTKIYYVAQFLYNQVDIERVNNKGTVINVFVTDDEYKVICQKNVGDVFKVSVSPDLSTGKLYYKVVL